MGLTYDSGALVAADRGERAMWARHITLLARGETPTVPAPVVAQGWRGDGPRQARLSRLLRGCDVEAMGDERARATGKLAARAGVADVVDAFVVEGALRRADTVVTSDPDDIVGIANATGRTISVLAP